MSRYIYAVISILLSFYTIFSNATETFDEQLTLDPLPDGSILSFFNFSIKAEFDSCKFSLNVFANI